MSCLSGAMNRLTLGGRPVQAARVGHLFAGAAPRVVASRTSVVVEAKQNSLRRERVAARNTLYNKHYINLIASSSRKAMKGYAELLTRAKDIKSEADLQAVDGFQSIAYSNIDKAVVKGVIHVNTGGRRKAKITRVRRRVLAAAGLYVPPVVDAAQ